MPKGYAKAASGPCARGIGEAIRVRLAGDGARVSVLDLELESAARVAPQIRRLEGRRTHPGQQCRPASRHLLHQTILDVWASLAGVHLGGAFLMSRAVHGFMREAAWGRIVNMSSMSALGNRGQTNYAAAKAGLRGPGSGAGDDVADRAESVRDHRKSGRLWLDRAPMTEQTEARLGISFDEFPKRVVPTTRWVGPAEPGEVAVAVSYFVGGRRIRPRSGAQRCRRTARLAS